MSQKHNKKRNPVFLFEILATEYAKTKNKIIPKIIKEHYNKKNQLFWEYRVYKDLLEVIEESKENSEKMLREAKERFESLNHKQLFNEKTKLINHINQNFNTSVYSNFVPNYKTLATIYQILNKTTNTRNAILLENNLLDRMQMKRTNQEKEKVDKIVINKFLENFNKKYTQELNESQQKLIQEYVFSFDDDKTRLKSFLNEEVSKLKKTLKQLLEDKEFFSDELMRKQGEDVLKLLESFREKPIDEQMILSVMKVYNLLEVAKT